MQDGEEEEDFTLIDPALIKEDRVPRLRLEDFRKVQDVTSEVEDVNPEIKLERDEVTRQLEPDQPLPPAQGAVPPTPPQQQPSDVARVTTTNQPVRRSNRNRRSRRLNDEPPSVPDARPNRRSRVSSSAVLPAKTKSPRINLQRKKPDRRSSKTRRKLTKTPSPKPSVTDPARKPSAAPGALANQKKGVVKVNPKKKRKRTDHASPVARKPDALNDVVQKLWKKKLEPKTQNPVSPEEK